MSRCLSNTKPGLALLVYYARQLPKMDRIVATSKIRLASRVGVVTMTKRVWVCRVVSRFGKEAMACNIRADWLK